MQIRGGPTTVIGDGGATAARPATVRVISWEGGIYRMIREPEDLLEATNFGNDGKGPPLHLFGARGFLLCWQLFVGGTMQKTTNTESSEVIAYRRTCNAEGENTGLSHYILMDKEAETDNEE